MAALHSTSQPPRRYSTDAIAFTRRSLVLVIDLQSSHMQAVLTGLSPVERALMLGHLGTKPAEYTNRLVAAVSSLPVCDAIQIIRTTLPSICTTLAGVNFAAGGPS
jgi:hypothetical protein